MCRADGNDDEHHFDPFEQHRLEGGPARQIVGTTVIGLPPQRGSLLGKGLVFVVQRDDADAAQDRLPEPAHAEQDQKHADHELQNGDRNQRQQRPEGQHQRRQNGQRQRSTRQRRAPAARHADGKHDGEGFDHFDEGRQERSRHGGEDGCQAMHEGILELCVSPPFPDGGRSNLCSAGDEAQSVADG